MKTTVCPPEVHKSILVIDDERNVRRVLRVILEECGYRVFEAADGRAAYHCIQKHQTDLVITDLVMPGEEGLETIPRLLALAPGLKIIAMSGAAEGVYLQLAIALGAAKALRKPFSCYTVVKMIDDLLETCANPPVCGGVRDR